MTIILPLQPQEEAKLVAAARAKGLSTEALIREAVQWNPRWRAGRGLKKEPTLFARGLLAKYGPAPSAEEIDRNRAEMLADFPHADF
jgi:hypothetical protein